MAHKKLNQLELVGRQFISRGKLQRCIHKVTKNPDDPASHKLLGDLFAFRREWIQAIAQYRTSLALGNKDENVFLLLAKTYLSAKLGDHAINVSKNFLSESKSEVKQKAEQILKKTNFAKSLSLATFNHNRFYRMKTLADHLISLFGKSDFSLLDVGGGDGLLALFLPETRYVLAEPTVNGISVNAFNKKSFDAIVACHVLEHIASDKRTQFLEQLTMLARKYVILLNPFFEAEGHEEERLRLIIELTKAPWAREHLECKLPRLEEVKQFAENYNFSCKIFPNGSLATTLAFVFLDHYINLSSRNLDSRKINHFFNTHLFHNLTNPELPTAYLVEICSSPLDEIRTSA